MLERRVSHDPCTLPPCHPQAPARRQHTQQAYGEVAARFAAAAQADAAAAAPAAPAEEPSSGSAAGAGDAAAAAAAGEDGRVQLQLDFDGSDSQRVAVRLLPAAPSAVTTASATSTAASSAGGSRPQLEWQLRLAPRPDGGMAAVLVPVEVGADAAAPTAEAQQAGVAGGGSAGTSTSACSSASAPAGSEGRIGEGSIAAVVAAARFMHHQLNELKADVAAARLSLLKGLQRSLCFLQAGQLVFKLASQTGLTVLPGGLAAQSRMQAGDPPTCLPSLILGLALHASLPISAASHLPRNCLQRQSWATAQPLNTSGSATCGPCSSRGTPLLAVAPAAPPAAAAAVLRRRLWRMPARWLRPG